MISSTAGGGGVGLAGSVGGDYAHGAGWQSRPGEQNLRELRTGFRVAPDAKPSLAHLTL